MVEDDSAPVLAISLTYEQFGRCVDISRAINELSYRIPGMLWRSEWQEALDILDRLDPDGVLDRVLDVLSVRLAFLGSFVSDETALVGMVDGTGYRRFTADDLEHMKDLLVRADHASVKALANSRAPVDRTDCRLYEAAVSSLLLAADMLKHEKASLRTWLRVGRGLHGMSAALYNADFVRLVFEALDEMTFQPRGWPPEWRNLMLVCRTWYHAVCDLGRYVALPPTAASDVVETALCMLPSTRMMICSLSHLSVAGLGGLSTFLDLLRNAHALATLRIADWTQCDAISAAVEQLEAVTLPRVRDFELIGAQTPSWILSPNPTVSLIRYLRLPAVEFLAISEPVEQAGDKPPLIALAAHLEAVAAVMPSTVPCIRGTQQFTLSTDMSHGGFVLRTRRSLESIHEDVHPSLTVHIYAPSAPPGASMPSSPLATHLFLQLCQTLAPRVPIDGKLRALPLDSLAVMNVNVVGARYSSEVNHFLLPHHPPWAEQYDSRRILSELPIYYLGPQPPIRPPRIMLYLDSRHDSTALLPIRALDLQQLERYVPSHAQLEEPAIEHVEFYGDISAHFLRQNMWQSAEFHDILRVRAARGMRIDSIAFTGVHAQWHLPIQSLKDAARSWGDGVDVQCQIQKNGIALVFQPLQRP